MSSERDPVAETSAPVMPSQKDVAERQRRFDALRAAQSALPPSNASRDVTAEAMRGISLWLEKLTEHVRSAEAGNVGLNAIAREMAGLRDALALLDADLNGYAALLRRLLDEIPAEPLRACLFEIAPHERSRVVALLDLVLEDEANLHARCEILEQLATWLSTDERQGRRRVVVDPAIAAPRLLAVSQPLAAASGDTDGIERVFVDAAGRCEEGDLGAIARAMTARKAELGLAIFAPSILRAVVFYNTAVWNRERGQSAEDPIAQPGADIVGKPEADRADRAAGREAAIGADVAETPPTPRAAESPGESERAIRALLAKAPLATLVRATARPSTRSGVRLASLVMIAIGTALLWLGGLHGSVQLLSPDQLRSLSPQLASAYRDGSGFGPLFIGTVVPGWRRLSLSDRERSAQKLASELSRDGVREMLLYDADHRITVHYAEGLPIHVAR